MDMSMVRKTEIIIKTCNMQQATSKAVQHPTQGQCELQ